MIHKTYVRALAKANLILLRTPREEVHFYATQWRWKSSKSTFVHSESRVTERAACELSAATVAGMQLQLISVVLPGQLSCEECIHMYVHWMNQ